MTDALSVSVRREMALWAWLAAGALAVAGALALLLVLSRVPQTQVLLPWSWQSFFYTGLITHVILSFEVWFLAVLGLLAALATHGIAPGRLRWAGLGLPGAVLATLGTLLLLVPTFLNEGEPSLNNYVPVLVHPLYYGGLVLIGIGVTLPVLRLLATPETRQSSLGFGTNVAGLLYLIALLCIALAGLRLPAELDIQTWNERLFWGGGHILQFVNTALMLTVWLLVTEAELGEAPVSPRLFRLLTGSLVAFALPGLAFYGMFGILSLEHRLAFTDLLWYGITVPPVVAGAGLLLLLVRRRAEVLASPSLVGLGISLALFLVGGVMGFFLGASDARTPSHYHASIGGVNLAFMALFMAVVLPALGRKVGSGWPVRAQFHFYGWGQMVFSVGMFVAGAAGVPRKTMGAEAQGLDSILKKLAMGVYGLGGALAVAGGVLFIWLVLNRLLSRKEAVDG